MDLQRLKIGIAVLPLLLIAACGGSGGGSAGAKGADASPRGTFDVVFVGGLSGPLATTTVPAVNALKAAAQDIDAHGGMNGENVKIETFDGQGDPTKSVTALQDRLSSGTKPDLLFLGISSTEALAMVPAATRAGIASTFIASSPLLNKPDENKLSRGITNSATNQLVGVPDYLKKKNAKSVDIMTTQDATGDAYVAGLKAALADAGVTIKEQRVATDELDTSSAWDKVVSDRPDVVYVNCLGDPCARILDGRLKAGATDIPLLGGISMAVTGSGPISYVKSPDSLKNADMIAYGFGVKSSSGADSDMLKRFLQARSGADKNSSVVTPALTWDALYAFKYAADKAKSKDATAMIKALDSGLPASDTFVTRAKLSYQGNVLPLLTARDMAIIPATTPVSEGRFVLAS